MVAAKNCQKIDVSYIPRDNLKMARVSPIVWAASCADDRMNDVRCLLNVPDSIIERADLAAPKVPYSIVVINSKFPYRSFLSGWENNGVPFYIINLDNSPMPFEMCLHMTHL